MSYYHKTQGREYLFSLEEDGFLHCKDLGLFAEKLDDLKSLVNEAVKKEKALPRIPVLYIEGRWDRVGRYYEATASGKSDRNGYRWISYKFTERHAKVESIKRQLVSGDRLILDTPENREFLDQAVLLNHDIDKLVELQQTLLKKMKKIGTQADEEE